MTLCFFFFLNESFNYEVCLYCFTPFRKGTPNMTECYSIFYSFDITRIDWLSNFKLWNLYHYVILFSQGYHGDTSKTFFCGDVDDRSKKLVQVAISSLENFVEGLHIIYSQQYYIMKIIVRISEFIPVGRQKQRNINLAILAYISLEFFFQY